MTKQLIPWKKVVIGSGLKTIGDFLLALEEARVRLGGSATVGVEYLLNNFPLEVSTAKKEVELFEVSVGDLLSRKGTLEEIFTAAKERGFSICSAEIALQTALQSYLRDCGRIIVSMEPIPLQRGEPHCLSLDRDACCYSIGAYPASKTRVYEEGVSFLFRKEDNFVVEL